MAVNQHETVVAFNTHLRPLGEVIGGRVKHLEALNPDFLQQLFPDIIAKFPVHSDQGFEEFGVANVISPYTENLPHCMFLM